MKQHKFNQINFNLLGSFSDKLEATDYKVVTDTEKVIEGAVLYLTLPTQKIEFPAKSYAVALIYAHLLEIHFNESFYGSLSDAELFCGNDVHFVPYSRSPEIYEEILRQIGGADSLLKYRELPQIQTTLFYFSEEFGIDFKKI